MAINIKNLEELIQKKVHTVTSSTPTADLGDMVEASLLATNSLREYDSAGALPTASTSNEKIAFVGSDKSIRFNNGTKWDALISGAAQAGSSGGGATADNIAQGVSYGYTAGGEFTPVLSPTVGDETIEKFAFASDGNATDVGDLAEGQGGAAGRHDGTIALILGGTIMPTNAMTNKVQAFTFASGTDAAVTPYVLGNQANYSARGVHQTPDIAYVTGGYKSPPLSVYSTINKYPFANNSNATTVVDPSNNMQQAFHSSGSMSPTHAYFGGTWAVFTPASTDAEVLRKYPFATSDGSSSDVGDMLPGSPYGMAGITGPTHGYAVGGAGFSNVIQKYPFASDASATDVGDMQVAMAYAGGNQSPSFGYINAGGIPSGYPTSIEKFTFPSDNPSTDVGDLTVAGHKYAANMQI